jgi:hypothetical protein
MQIDWAVVFATIAGPFFAVWAADIRAARKAQRDRQEWVFRTLMTTRRAKLQPHHVEALNQIDFAFPQSSHSEVSEAWKLYQNQLSTSYGQNQEEYVRWSDKLDSLFESLAHLMAKDLNIPFPKSLIKTGGYYPKGFVDAENQNAELRALLLEVLKGERPLPIRPLP